MSTPRHPIDKSLIRHVLLIAQQSRCAVCLTVRQSLYIDHCHRCDRVRGLLCRSCNITEGKGPPFSPVMRQYRWNPPTLLIRTECFYGGWSMSCIWWEGCGWCKPEWSNTAHRLAIIETVACPECGAARGNWCRTIKRGVVIRRTRLHAQRWEASGIIEPMPADLPMGH